MRKKRFRVMAALILTLSLIVSGGTGGVWAEALDVETVEGEAVEESTAIEESAAIESDALVEEVPTSQESASEQVEAESGVQEEVLGDELVEAPVLGEGETFGEESEIAGSAADLEETVEVGADEYLIPVESDEDEDETESESDSKDESDGEIELQDDSSAVVGNSRGDSELETVGAAQLKLKSDYAKGAPYNSVGYSINSLFDNTDGYHFYYYTGNYDPGLSYNGAKSASQCGILVSANEYKVVAVPNPNTIAPVGALEGLGSEDSSDLLGSSEFEYVETDDEQEIVEFAEVSDDYSPLEGVKIAGQESGLQGVEISGQESGFETVEVSEQESDFEGVEIFGQESELQGSEIELTDYDGGIEVLEEDDETEFEASEEKDGTKNSQLNNEKSSETEDAEGDTENEGSSAGDSDEKSVSTDSASEEQGTEKNVDSSAMSVSNDKSEDSEKSESDESRETDSKPGINETASSNEASSFSETSSLDAAESVRVSSVYKAVSENGTVSQDEASVSVNKTVNRDAATASENKTVSHDSVTASENKTVSRGSIATASENKTVSRGSIDTASENKTVSGSSLSEEKDDGTISWNELESVGANLRFIVSINKARFTISSASATKTYDGSSLTAKSFTFMDENGRVILPDGNNRYKLIGNDMVSFNSVRFTGEVDKVSGTPSANTFTYKMTFYPITVSGNYEIKKSEGQLLMQGVNTRRLFDNANNLPAPEKLKAIMDQKGRVKLTWNKVKSNGKGKKTYYEIWRLNTAGTWDCLNESEVKAQSKKSAKNTYTDKTALVDTINKGADLLYRIVPVGQDVYGTMGEGEAAYCQAAPFVTEMATGHSYEDIRIEFVSTNAPAYLVYHKDTKKGSDSEQVEVKPSEMTLTKYAGKKKALKNVQSSGVVANVFTYFDEGSDICLIKDLHDGDVEKKADDPHSYTMKFATAARMIYVDNTAVSVPASEWVNKKTIKLGEGTAPGLESVPSGLRDVVFKFTGVKSAKSYKIEISTSPDFQSGSETKVITATKSSNKKIFNNQKLDVSQIFYSTKNALTPGKYYYCKVTALNRNGSVLNAAGAISKTVSECGRPYPVTNLKAKWSDSNQNNKADAELSWGRGSNELWEVYGYKITRKVYKYNSSTKAFDVEDKAYSGIVQDCKLNSTNSATSFVSTVANKIPTGERVRYTVVAVYNNNGTMIEGTESHVDFLNPSSIEFKKDTYKLTAKSGQSVTPVMTFEPKITPKSAMNETLVYSIDEDLSDYEDYISINEKTGKVKALSKVKSGQTFTILARSKADFSVYATAEIKTVGSSSGSDSSGSSSGSSSSSSSSEDADGLVVCLDAGHGGSDGGATKGNTLEKDLNLKLSDMVGEYLEEMGATVYYTRTDDTYVSLTDRTDYAESKDCNLFVSLHCNSTEKSSTKGTCVYYSLKSEVAKQSLASHISKAVANALGTTNNGAKTRQGEGGNDYYSVIRTSAAKGIPGLIVEHAYISNSDDRKALNDGDKLRAAAKAEAEAIAKYWNS
ncbi:MAG: N-acetylmuramoyl-L-alanine amidase [Lachnospiraceae bacterium]|nr:N-acetylmuramoyl-L-alanine amidase [Lachnospiraceae bacterium]